MITPCPQCSQVGLHKCIDCEEEITNEDCAGNRGRCDRCEDLFYEKLADE